MRHRYGRCHRGHLLEALVLLLIAEQPSHGYDIAKKLSEFGLDFDNIAVMGNLYRLLSRLEVQGGSITLGPLRSRTSETSL